MVELHRGGSVINGATPSSFHESKSECNILTCQKSYLVPVQCLKYFTLLHSNQLNCIVCRVILRCHFNNVFCLRHYNVKNHLRKSNRSLLWQSKTDISHRHFNNKAKHLCQLFGNVKIAGCMFDRQSVWQTDSKIVKYSSCQGRQGTASLHTI